MKSIKLKIALVTGIISIIVGSALGFYCSNLAKSTLENVAKDELTSIATQAASTIAATTDGEYSYLEALALNDFVYNSYTDPIAKKKYLLKLADTLEGVSDIGFADVNGKTYAPDCQTIVDISTRDYFQKAMSGERVASDPVESIANPEEMIMTFAVPVYDKEQIVGVLFLVCDGNFLSNISNSIKFGKTGALYIINDNGTTVAHYDLDKVAKHENVTHDFADKPDFRELIATQKEVLAKESGNSSYVYQGVRKCVGYSKIPATKWHAIAITPYEEINAGAIAMGRGIFVITITVVIIACFVGLFTANRIVKPIKAIEHELSLISDGDLSNVIPQKLLKIKDETGRLARAMKKMQDSLKGAIEEVNTQANQVVDYSDNQVEQITALQANVESVSATTQELSASSEEMAASAEEMTTAAGDAQAAVENISERAQDGAKTADEIRQRAKQLESSTLESQKVATDIYTQSMTLLTKAIDDSKRVMEINQLSDAILGITSQTNLLALNASIEAARAGEVGRGFSVVASEIGKLADDSQQSANQIKSVTEDVISSVENLSSGAQNILEFIDGIVMKDYEKMVDTSRQYNDDAVKIDELVTDLSATSEELFATITDITERLNQVSKVTGEFAAGTANIAESTSDIAQKTANVSASAKDTKECTGKLSKAISIFKIGSADQK